MKSQLADWRSFYNEAKSFHKTAQGSVRRPEVFTPGLVHNLSAMSIEKYFMAIFMHRGLLPRNHTMGDLLEEAKPLFPIDAEIEETLRYMDSLQAICSVEHFKITEPRREDIPRFLKALEAVSAIAAVEIGPAAESV